MHFGFAHDFVRPSSPVAPVGFAPAALTVAGETPRVSVPCSNGEGEGGGSFRPSMSSNGRVVAFRLSATNLVSDDSNATGDVFVDRKDD